jgi:2-keto-4-pentenoate hydratase/2-oxohepta-3-ene-1,7-dioic acid hydratase in catechol pathway
LRIIRYKINENHKPEFGCVEEDKVFSIIGDPLIDAKQGKLIAFLDDVKLLSPCQPKKIIAMAINFSGIDGYSPSMKEPMVFIKPGTCVCNPGDTGVNPFPDLPWWGEAELGVVIKKRLRNISPDNVSEGILGFTIGNDVTVENVEGRDHHLARSKCPDGFCPLGPWIDTAFDASDCLIEAVQNGEVIRRGRSSQQVWQWPQIISWLSTWMTLDPWDVVLTGNPPDTVGMRYLADGDTYTARIKGLGELTNSFQSAPPKCLF